MIKAKKLATIGLTSLALLTLAGCSNNKSNQSPAVQKVEKKAAKEKAHTNQVKSLVAKANETTISSAHMSQTINAAGNKSDLDGDFDIKSGLLNMTLSVNNPPKVTNEYWYQVTHKGKGDQYKMYARTKGMSNWQWRNIKAGQNQLSVQEHNIETQRAIWAQMVNSHPDLINVSKSDDGSKLTIKNTPKVRSALKQILNLDSQHRTVAQSDLELNVDNMGVPVYMHMTLNTKSKDKGLVKNDETFMQINKRNNLAIPKNVIKKAKKMQG